MTAPPLLASLCVIIATSTFSIGGFPALLPELSTVAGLADWELGIVTGVFGFARMVADIPVGLLITRHLRRGLLAAPVVLLAGMLCLGTGGPLWMLVLGRALMGVGHTLGMLAGLTIILRYSAAARLASALNAYEFSAMLGMVGGVALVGALPAALSWNVVLMITCAPQLVGLLVLPLALAALSRQRPVSPAEGVSPRRPRPGRGRVSPLLVLAFAAGAGIALTYTTVEQFVLPLRGSREFGLDRAGVAWLLVVTQVTDILALLPVGFLADRRGTGRMLALVLLSLSTGALLMAFGTLPLMVLGCVALGLGMAGWMLPLGLLRMVTPPERIGWLTALYRVCVDAGMFLGPFLSGFLGAGRARILPLLFAAGMIAMAVRLLRYPYSRHSEHAPAREGRTAPS